MSDLKLTTATTMTFNDACRKLAQLAGDRYHTTTYEYSEFPRESGVLSPSVRCKLYIQEKNCTSHVIEAQNWATAFAKMEAELGVANPVPESAPTNVA